MPPHFSAAPALPRRAIYPTTPPCNALPSSRAHAKTTLPQPLATSRRSPRCRIIGACSCPLSGLPSRSCCCCRMPSASRAREPRYDESSISLPDPAQEAHHGENCQISTGQTVTRPAGPTAGNKRFDPHTQRATWITRAPDRPTLAHTKTGRQNAQPDRTARKRVQTLDPSGASTRISTSP